jgi:hypothetical protein
LRVEDLEDLSLIGLGVLLDLLAGERRTRHVAPRWIADHASEIADDKDHRVPQVLEVLHLAQQDGVAQMQVGRSWIEAGLDAEGLAIFFGLLKLVRQFADRDDFGGALQ